MYALVCTRPDLAQTVSIASKYIGNPRRQHRDTVKWICRYLKGTTNYRIAFVRQNSDLSILGYVDTNYARDLDDRTSTTGYVFTLTG
jgi:hypothetical protein